MDFHFPMDFQWTFSNGLSMDFQWTFFMISWTFNGLLRFLLFYVLSSFTFSPLLRFLLFYVFPMDFQWTFCNGLSKDFFQWTFNGLSMDFFHDIMSNIYMNDPYIDFCNWHHVSRDCPSTSYCVPLVTESELGKFSVTNGPLATQMCATCDWKWALAVFNHQWSLESLS